MNLVWHEETRLFDAILASNNANTSESPMPSSAILDVAIGIAFVYLFLSLICSVVNEGIAAVFSLRSKNLVAGIDSLLSGSTLQDNRPIVELLYSHGLIRGLYKDPPK